MDDPVLDLTVCQEQYTTFTGRYGQGLEQLVLAPKDVSKWLYFAHCHTYYCPHGPNTLHSITITYLAVEALSRFVCELLRPGFCLSPGSFVSLLCPPHSAHTP